jgi:hypothetical protein
MANAFVNFLSQAVNASGNLRDYQHANRLYVVNNYELAPKAGWIYYVQMNINPEITGAIIDPTLAAEFQAWYTRYGGRVGLLAKQADLPKFTVETETLNQYNRKTVIQKRINYGPINITFHDDMANATTNLWKSYYQYYYADSLDAIRAGENLSILPKYEDTKYRDGVEFTYGLNNRQTVPFFTSIDVYQLNRKQYTSFKIVNPVVKEWAHDQLDQTQGNRVLTSKLTVEYETVIYDTNPTNTTSLENPGFAIDHYDTTPSPLSIGGQGTNSILGPGGIIAGAGDIFGTLSNLGTASPLDLLNTAIKGANLVRNAKSISKAGIKEEASGVLRGVIGNINSTPAAVRNPDGTVTRVPASDRVSQGVSQSVAGIQQILSPVGITLPSIGGATNNTVPAVAKIL